MRPVFYILMIVTGTVFALRFLVLNVFNTRYRQNNASYYVFCAVYYGMTAAGTLLLMGWDGINTLSLVLALLYGTFYVFNLFFYLKAVLIGPIGYSTLITSVSLIIPILYAFLVRHEAFKTTQLAGLGLLILAFYLGSGASGKDDPKPMSLKWLACILTAFLFSGAVCTIYKEQQMLFPGQYIGGFLTTAFSTATVLSLVMAAAYVRREGQGVKGFRSRWVWVCALGAGFTTLAGNLLNMNLSSRVPSIVLFPLVNGTNVVLTAILSYTCFREKATARGIAGLVIGVTAMCLIGI